MKKLMAFLAVIIIIAASSVVFAEVMLTDNFNITGGTTTNLNTELATRQTGSCATTNIVKGYEYGGVISNDSTGVLKMNGGVVLAYFDQDFFAFLTVGKTLHYSVELNSISNWSTICISNRGFAYGYGISFSIEVAGGHVYIHSETSPGVRKTYYNGGTMTPGLHRWDMYVTQQSASIKHVEAYLDGSATPIYTNDCDSSIWTGGALNLQANNIAEYDNISVELTPGQTADSGYIATSKKTGGGINIIQVDNGSLRQTINTYNQPFYLTFAPNGDIYYTGEDIIHVYKATYKGNGIWGGETHYVTLPGVASSLAVRSDGTLFVGTLASDEIYRIDPDKTITKMVGPLSPGGLGWYDMAISSDGEIWTTRQNTGIYNYDDTGAGGLFYSAGTDFIRGLAFANGMLYGRGSNSNSIYEYDPSDPNSGVPFITTDFNPNGWLVDRVTSLSYGPDANGDGYGDFYMKLWHADGYGSEWIISYTIKVYSGKPGLDPTARFIRDIDFADIREYQADTYPKGNEVAPPLPTMNYSDDVVVDGDLSDWDDTTFIPMNVAYYPDPSVNLDMTNAAFAHKWGAGGTKVYLALKVQDAQPVWNDWYTYWNVNDHVETQLWASSTLSGENDQNICNIFQQYELGLQEDGISNWSYMCGAGTVPSFASLNYAVTQGVDGWVFYEAAMTPFETFSRLDEGAVTTRILIEDDVIGADAVIASKNIFTDFNMIAADGNVGKSANTSKILKQKLVREGVMGSIDLQNYDVSKLGIAGTATITDGTNTEIHNIVLDTAGLYLFATALRGDCTVIVKCSHWLGKAASVIVPSTGNVVVDLLSIINGDVVESNEVDFDDINATRAAYGSFPGDENWNARADVDGTGEVDFTDINIVRSKYGEIGE